MAFTSSQPGRQHRFRMRCRRLTAAGTMILAGISPSGAQTGSNQPGKKPGIEFELGAFAAVAPSYEGSDSYVAYPFPSVRFHALRLKNGYELGGGDEQGLSLFPSFRYVGRRSFNSDDALFGLPDVDPSLELGAGFSYRIDNFRAFLELRYGVIGHNGFVGETGIDWISKPLDKLTVTVGPHLSFASEKYMNTYFGVSPNEALRAGVAGHELSAGLKTIGISSSARYKLDRKWTIEGRAKWDRLVGEAGSSPVTSLGDQNQYSFSIGLTRKFSIGF